MTTLSERAARNLSPELREKFDIQEDGEVQHLIRMSCDRNGKNPIPVSHLIPLEHDFSTCSALALELCIHIGHDSDTEDDYIVVVPPGGGRVEESISDHNGDKQRAASVAICRAIEAMKQGE